MTDAWKNIERKALRHKGQFPTSISDLQERYYNHLPLTTEELRALANYDKKRITYLNSAPNEEEFQKRYLEMQAKANLGSYEEFL